MEGHQEGTAKGYIPKKKGNNRYNIHFKGLNICFRMDSGYFDEEIIKAIESLGFKYVIKAKAYGTLVSKVPSNEFI